MADLETSHATLDHTGLTGVGGTVATDAIWDAKGDLAAGTGANAGAKLTAGSDGMVPVYDSAQTQGLKTDYPPGYEFDYAEVTSQVTVTATSEGAATTILSGNAITYDGSTTIEIEFFMSYIAFNGAVNDTGQLALYDGGSSIGTIGAAISAQVTGVTINGDIVVKRRLTPSAAAHTYSLRGWKNANTFIVGGGAGGSGNNLPGYIRITKV